MLMLNRPSLAGTAEPLGGAQTLDLRQALNFAWRQWKLIAAVLVASLLVGAAFVSLKTPLYTATTQILLDPRKEKAAGTEAILSDFNMDVASIESQIAILRSSSLLRRVVEKEKLTQDPEFGSVKGTSPDESSADAANPPPVASSAAAEPLSREMIRSINRLSGASVIRRTGQAYVLAVSVTSVSPQRAARLANAIADAYIVDKLEARFDAARRASAWLNERLEDLRKQLRSSEEAVARYRSEMGIVQTTPNATLNQDQLAQLNARLVAARGEVAEKKARLDMLRSGEGRAGVARSIPDGTSPLLASLKSQEADISRREADLVARYSDRHPLVVNIRAEKRDVQRGIETEMQRIAENIKNEYDLAVARQTAIEKTLSEVTGLAGIDSRTAITLREMERTVAVNKSLFEEFLQRAKVTQEQSTFEARESRVITPATPPNVPSFPRKTQTLMIVGLFGLLLGFAAAMAVEMLNSGFTTPKQIEQTLGVPVLASIGRLSEKDLTIKGKPVLIPLLTTAKPLARFSEAIRSLRSGIQMTDVDKPPKIIQVTSSLPAEGKTSIALSLAASAAQSELKVLLIDADLRNPSSSRLVGMDKQPGLVELLLAQSDARNVVRFFEPGKFWVLCAGGKTQNPVDLLGSERMRGLVEGFGKTFDYIVIDTPPLGPVVDAIVVSQLVEKVVYVVRWSDSPREIVSQSIQRLKNVAGIVLNYVDDSRMKKYGQGAYSYYGTGYYKNYYSE